MFSLVKFGQVDLKKMKCKMFYRMTTTEYKRQQFKFKSGKNGN